MPAAGQALEESAAEAAHPAGAERELTGPARNHCAEAYSPGLKSAPWVETTHGPRIRANWNETVEAQGQAAHHHG